MDTSTLSVSMLHRVALQIRAGRTAEAMDILPEPVPFNFILGLGTDGLTPFEKEIAGKAPGETLVLMVSGEQWRQIFGHLMPPPGLPPLDTGKVCLEIYIEGTQAAQQREVIKGLAEVANYGDYGCGGGCGCGCG